MGQLCRFDGRMERTNQKMSGRSNSVFRVAGILAAVMFLAVAGCGRPTATQSVDQLLKESGQSRADVFPLAGKITIDGETPPGGGFKQQRMTLVLFEQGKLDARLEHLPKAYCDATGAFAFSTYGTGDGVPPGKYVLAIVEMKFEKRKGASGADVLKNLYNDPDQNLKDPDLVIDHQAPGKKDYYINLKLAGREAGSKGPHSVLKIN